MAYHIYSFEKLEVYKSSRIFRVNIRKLLKTFPLEEKYDLVSQLKRAADSIGTNIAVGSGRSSNFDQAHFTNVAFSSAMEVIDHLNTSLDMNYISQEKYEELRFELDRIAYMLNSLYKFQLGNKENTLKRNQNK
ncbi:four helix bundle protein [Belliella sp. R4-6]|uniref:Four helix bundle protein n=1 Tax=Belliella alkalica TaxID=1730871 RepID=A0ABS9VDX6_9BACT|nr:four helix bundle protein [Belliella alkalica]MCH7414636.1 four helix bundle protein [Belliella alkalica]